VFIKSKFLVYILFINCL